MQKTATSNFNQSSGSSIGISVISPTTEATERKEDIVWFPEVRLGTVKPTNTPVYASCGRKYGREDKNKSIKFFICKLEVVRRGRVVRKGKERVSEREEREEGRKERGREGGREGERERWRKREKKGGKRKGGKV